MGKDNARTICGKTLQGISLKKNNKISISTGTIKTQHFCLDSWIDEKEFSGLSSGLYDNK